MRFFLALITICCGLQVEASTVTVAAKVEFHFDLVKTDHSCNGLGSSNPGPGNCGSYQDLILGQSYAGFASLDGEFETTDGLTFRYLGGSEICQFGTRRCAIRAAFGSQSAFNALEVSYRPFQFSFNSNFYWDIAGGTGWHTWEDDHVPYSGKGRFEFSNVVTKSTLSTIPLSASAGFLLAGIAALGASHVFRRRIVRL